MQSNHDESSSKLNRDGGVEQGANTASIRAAAPLTRRALLRATVVTSGAAAISSPTAAQEVRPDWGGYLAAADGGFADRRGDDEVTVKVGAEGNGGNLAFSPAGLWIDPETTVIWEWTGLGGAHNVVTEEGPANLNSGDPVQEEGATYEYTFEETGITTYYCAPHRNQEMKGGIAVGDDVPTATPQPVGEEDEADGLVLPGGDTGSLIALAGFASVGIGALAVLAVEGWVRIRQPGTELSAPVEAPSREPVVEIGHDDFDPGGTLRLVIVYFLILLAMWVFTYFVEFLGNGPSVIG